MAEGQITFWLFVCAAMRARHREDCGATAAHEPTSKPNDSPELKHCLTGETTHMAVSSSVTVSNSLIERSGDHNQR